MHTIDSPIESYSKCRVYFDGDQVFGVTPTKVLFNQIKFDSNTEWDATNKRFIVKTAGYYLIIGQINYANWTQMGWLMCYKNYNITPEVLIMIGDKNGSALYLNFTTISYLNVGDYVEMWGNVLGVNAHVYGGDSNTFFAIHRLS